MQDLTIFLNKIIKVIDEENETAKKVKRGKNRLNRN